MDKSLFSLKNKVALVTGGSKGIGLGMASALGKFGAKIIIASRGVEDLQKAEKFLQEEGITARGIPVDVTDKKRVEELMSRIIEEYGQLDILVNNAGMNIRKPLVEIEENDWDKVLTTNLKGIFLVGQAAAKQMIRQKSGKMINISSIFGSVGMPMQTSYAASKGGINQLTKVWAAELAPHGMVNAIAAYIRTPMTESWLSDKTGMRKSLIIR